MEGGGDLLFELKHFVVVAFEEGEEGTLGAGGSFGAEEGDLLDEAVEVAGVEEEILEPEAETLADGGGLGGLVVGVAEAGVGSVFLGEGG